MHPEMSTIPAMRPTANIVNFPFPGLAVGAGVVGDLVGRSVVGACDGDADGDNVGVGALAAGYHVLPSPHVCATKSAPQCQPAALPANYALSVALPLSHLQNIGIG